MIHAVLFVADINGEEWYVGREIPKSLQSNVELVDEVELDQLADEQRSAALEQRK